MRHAVPQNQLKYLYDVTSTADRFARWTGTRNPPLGELLFMRGDYTLICPNLQATTQLRFRGELKMIIGREYARPATEVCLVEPDVGRPLDQSVCVIQVRAV